MAKRGKQKQKGKSPATEPVVEAASTAPGDIAAVEAAEALGAIEVEASAPADAYIQALDAVEADTALAITSAFAADAGTEIAEAPVQAAASVKRSRRVSSRPRDKRSPFLVLADYEQRSLAHVAGLPEQLDAPGLWRGVAYRVGSHRLASGFDEVVEIMPLPVVSHVPGSLPWMLGVANVRGTLLPVVDLKQFLEGERTVLHESQRVLVVRQPGGDVAVTIDELYGQRSFVDGQGIDTESVSEGRYAHFIDRAYRINDQDWGVFSLDRLARTPEFRQAAA
jgi:twitching motility protein PilI